MSDFVPADLALLHVPEVDPRLSEASDRALILWAAREGFDAIVSTNHRMLNQPDEVAAMVDTEMTMVFTYKMGHNPLRASGALFLQLPTLHQRLRRGSNVFLLRFEARDPKPAWAHLRVVADRQNVTVEELWASVRPTHAEAAADPWD